jgi:hypothetical protein
MEVNCPKCRGRLQIAEEHAGKYVRCPLCQNIFQTPVLPAPFPLVPPPVTPPVTPLAGSGPPPVSSGAAAAPSPSGPSGAPAPPPASAPRTSPPGVSPAPTADSAPPPGQQEISLPPPPTGQTPFDIELPPTVVVSIGAQHRWTIPLRRQVLPWLVVACLGIVFLLTFFPWVWYAETVTQNDTTQWGWRGQNAWGVTFVSRARNTPAIIYLIFLPLALLLSVAAALLPKLAKSLNIPLPVFVFRWRYAFVGGLLLFLLLLLFLQLLLAFAAEVGAMQPILRSAWLTWALFFHIFSLALAFLCGWLDQRSQQPEPRLELVW